MDAVATRARMANVSIAMNPPAPPVDSSGKWLSFGYRFFAPAKKGNSGAPAHETRMPFRQRKSKSAAATASNHPGDRPPHL
jgi:hypothetical protein